MVQGSIFRNRNSDDDFIDIMNLNTLERKFKKALNAEEQKHVKKHLPYCFRGALLDFGDEWETHKKNRARGIGQRMRQTEFLEKWIKRLPEYGDPTLFELRSDREVVENKLIDGLRTPVVVGHNLEFYSKDYDYRNTVFVPIDEYRKRKAKSQKS